MLITEFSPKVNECRGDKKLLGRLSTNGPVMYSSAAAQKSRSSPFGLKTIL